MSCCVDPLLSTSSLGMVTCCCQDNLLTRCTISPHFFQRVRISSIALIKMMIHTRAGGIYEVMGSMVGKVDVETRTFYIMDAFALPVQGTETRVNAGDEAYEFMVQWQESSQRVSRDSASSTAMHAQGETQWLT